MGWASWELRRRKSGRERDLLLTVEPGMGAVVRVLVPLYRSGVVDGVSSRWM